MKLKPQSDKNKQILEREIEKILDKVITGRYLGDEMDQGLSKLLSLFDEKLQEERERTLQEASVIVKNSTDPILGTLDYDVIAQEIIRWLNRELKSEEEHE